MSCHLFARSLTARNPFHTAVRGQSGMFTFHGPSDGGKLGLSLGTPEPISGTDEQFLMGGNSRVRSRTGSKGLLVRAVEGIYDHVKQVEQPSPS
jgi:hypothetical protein